MFCDVFAEVRGEDKRAVKADVNRREEDARHKFKTTSEEQRAVTPRGTEAVFWEKTLERGAQCDE